LIIGRDGTFAAGVLSADPAAVAIADTGTIPVAEFVGARARRERALAEADRLEVSANELDHKASDARSAAEAERAQANTVRAAGLSFPTRRPLEQAEAERSGAALRTQRAKTARDENEIKATAAAAIHQQVHDDWVGKARSQNMPADAVQLADIVSDRRNRAATVDKAVQALRKLITTLPRTLTLIIDEDELAARLAGLEYEARQALGIANATEALLDEVRRDSDAAEAIRRHRAALTERDSLGRELEPAKEKARQDRRGSFAAQAKVEPARQLLNGALPAQAETERLLSALLLWQPVAAALDIAGFLETTGETPTEGPVTGNQLLELAATLLAGKPTSARRTLNERYDEVRAELAQT
jgi:hypothetical protein